MRTAGIRRVAPRGFTLVEMLVTVAILAVVAAVAVPLLSSGDSKRLDVAAEETANLLRFAMSEARRTGGYVLVDGKTTSGKLAIYNSNASGNIPPSSGTSAIVDPLTKLAMVLDVTGSAFSTGVTLTPQFMAGGGARPQLLISTSALTALDSPSSYGPLQAGSGVLLSYGGQSITASINEVTGLVTLP